VSREVSASVEIGAAPERIWHVLTDFGEYSNWNPFIRHIDGPLARGAELTFTVATGPERTVVARARILEIEVNRRLVWGGGLPLGLFRGEHTFLIRPTARGAVLENSERFTGPIAALTIRDARLQAQRQAFEAFNEALKRRVETMAADSPAEATETS
jgi:hypothetical protein